MSGFNGGRRSKMDDSDEEERVKMVELEEKPGAPTLYNDLKNTMMKVLNYQGWYQKALFLAFVLNGLLYGISHTSTAFHIYTSKFYCAENGNIANSCDGLEDGTCPSGFKFEKDDYTIVNEWNLVCSRKALGPLVNTLYFVGVTLGALILGIATDKYGRKLIMLVCLFSQGILGLLLQFIPMLQLFIVLRMFQGFFVQGLQGACVALLFEYAAPRLRTTAVVAWHMGFSGGGLILAGISYFVRNWHTLQTMVTIPSIIIACYAWVLPESLYWLYATNQKREALKLTLRTAKLNRDEKMVDEINANYATELKEENKVDTKDQIEEKPEKAGLTDIWNTLCLKKHLLVMVLVNYAITIAYYGSVFFLNKLGGNRHVNFSVGSAVELVAFIVLLVVLKKIGTKYSIVCYQYGTGIICAIIGLIIVFMPNDNPNKDTIVVIFSLAAKAIGISAFALMILFNTELFPTICRGAAFGTCGFFARSGSISAPFFMLLADVSPMIPMAMLAVLLIFTGTLSLLMPDTRKGSLPHTIKEAKDLWE